MINESTKIKKILLLDKIFLKEIEELEESCEKTKRRHRGDVSTFLIPNYSINISFNFNKIYSWIKSAHINIYC